MITLAVDRASKARATAETGNWRVPPTVFRTPSGVVLRIEAEQDQHFMVRKDEQARCCAPWVMMQM